MIPSPGLPAGPSFLEARRRLATAPEGVPLALFLGTSGTADALLVFVRAVAAERGRAATIRVPPFGTLGQALLAPSEPGAVEVFLLFPWDILPEADWRTGVPPGFLDPQAAAAAAAAGFDRFRRRAGARVVYIAAPTLPLGSTASASAAIEASLVAAASLAGAAVLGPECFALGSYLSSGSPLAAATLGGVATVLVDRALAPRPDPKKVLVTDFDNTLWGGVLAEDGVEGVEHGAAGKGFRHFLYQTLLRRLRNEGAILAGVSRNAPDIVAPLLSSGRMLLGDADFVAVIATYGAKSAQIEALARRLNLGLDAFVFVDDNEIELEEVRQALPAVTGLRFPAREDDLPAFLGRIAALFGKDEITAEDRERTALYRRRLEGVVPEALAGADVTAFLRTLGMKLSVHDRTDGDRRRAVQLINKTNQFNLNGRRWSDEEVEALLASGGRLWTASLEDRSGSHGEIVGFLLGPDRVAEAWVMSCRVFQRRVESAFLLALFDRGIRVEALRFRHTERNEPFRRFLAELMLPAEDGLISLEPAVLATERRSDLELFEFLG